MFCDEHEHQKCYSLLVPYVQEGPIVFAGPAGSVVPLNPRGRTGEGGKGGLQSWGASHTVTVLLTRTHPVTQELQLVVMQHAQPKLRKKSLKTQSTLSAFLLKRPTEKLPIGDSDRKSSDRKSSLSEDSSTNRSTDSVGRLPMSDILTGSPLLDSTCSLVVELLSAWACRSRPLKDLTQSPLPSRQG